MVKDRPSITGVLWLSLVAVILAMAQAAPTSSPWLASCPPYGSGIFRASSSVRAIMVTLSLFFSFFSTDLSVCICLFVCICLSVYESVLWFVSEYFQQFLIFSVCLWLSFSLCYTYCHCTSSAHSPPPPPLFQWCNGAHCGPIVVFTCSTELWFSTPQKDVPLLAYLAVEFGIMHVIGYLSTSFYPRIT